MAIIAMLLNLDTIITLLFNLLYALMKINLLSDHLIIMNGVYYKRGGATPPLLS